MLKHVGTIVIETDRLLLRPFKIEDTNGMYDNCTSDIDVCKHMRLSPHKDKEDTKKMLSRWIDSYNNESFYNWAITLKGEDEPIGSIGLFIVNASDLCGDVAYCIGKKYWGQGIVTEALNNILNFAFKTVEFNRIEAYHSIKNPASGIVMQKCGMSFEGIAKQKFKSISGFEDSSMYSIIKDDFYKL